MITSKSIRLISQARGRASRWEELSDDEKNAYKDVHVMLKAVGEEALKSAKKYGQFDMALTSGFSLKSGIRGYLPKDLWVALYPKNADLGMPQIYMIVSENGVEYGFAPVIHPNDFSNQSYKEKIRSYAPSVVDAMPSVGSEAFNKLAQKLGSEWHFKKKTREFSAADTYESLEQYTNQMKFPMQHSWWGVVAKYAQVNDVEGLENQFLEAVEIFSPYVNEIAKSISNDNIKAGSSKGEKMGISRLISGFMKRFAEVSKTRFETDQELWSFASKIRQSIEENISSIPSSDVIKVKWSAGAGNWAKIPWFAMLDTNRTKTTEEGVYGVILFKEDMSGFYLTLALGVTSFTKKYGQAEGVKELRKTSQALANKVPELKRRSFEVDSIDLGATTTLGQNYERGTVVSKYYDASSMPSDEQIERDIKLLVTEYLKLDEKQNNQPSVGMSDNEQESFMISPQRVWVIALGESSEFYKEFYDAKQIGIGWDDLGDLKKYKDHLSIKNALNEAGESASDTNTNACWNFANEMNEGDLVLVRRGLKKVIAACRVTSDYQHDNSRTYYKNVRSVEWLYEGEVDPFPSFTNRSAFPIQTLNEITPNGTKKGRRYRPVLAHLLDEMGIDLSFDSLNEIDVEPEYEDYTIEDALEDLFLDKGTVERILHSWMSKKNIILQGPPGVGKTFIAKRLAYTLIGKKNPELLKMVQFHQSYSYEDFIQGYKPTEGGFTLKNGVFYTFCKEAQDNPDTPYVFIIDEINRGNLSKIFGELMMLIERDKRGEQWSMPLTYSDDGVVPFHVPDNVYLLGMMNTADRSLSMVDYALRRRFAFVDLEPQFTSDKFREALVGQGAESTLVNVLIARIEELNSEIADDKINLGAGFRIGHSFFCAGKETEIVDKSWYRNVIETEILPLLNEYWFDDEQKVQTWKDRLLADF